MKSWRLICWKNTTSTCTRATYYDFPGDGYLVVSLITPEQDFREGMGRILSAV